MQKIIIITIFLLTVNTTYGQGGMNKVSFVYDGNVFDKRQNDFIIKNNSFSLFLGNYVVNKYPELQSICSSGVFFIKFKLRATGLIDSLSATIGADTAVTRIFKQSIKQNEKYWRISIPNSETTLLFPVQYSYGGGCGSKITMPSFSLSGQFEDGTKINYLLNLILNPLVQNIGYGQQLLKDSR